VTVSSQRSGDKPGLLAVIEKSHQTQGDDDVAQSSPVQETAGHKPATRRRRQSEYDAIIDQAHALYGSDAATAVVYCGLDAWFEGEEVEFRRFARLFRRLRN